MLRHPRQLVLTVDAFGTLFTPREPIGKSYAEIARRHGLSGFVDDQIASSFHLAFKQEQSKTPNYGKQAGMKAAQWWSNAIHSTFRSFIPSASLPQELVPDLLNRFSSSEGYELYPDVIPMFDALRRRRSNSKRDPASPKLIVGVITNSDDRVPSVLSSLGLKVSPWRYGMLPEKFDYPQGTVDDIDFVVMSYDVGYEKPAREIFDAAKEIAYSGWVKTNQGVRFIHVGDDFEKDFIGAEQAGWESVLLDRDGEHGRSMRTLPPASSIANLRELNDHILQDERIG